MKKLLLMAFAALAGLAFGQGDDDVSVVFSTEGPDRYMDGSVVLDGECYALVWSTDGVFEGFSADGAALDPADKVVRVAPLAKNGRCRALFQLTAAEADVLAGGIYAVYLLDTRVQTGDGMCPGGVVDGRPQLVNAYGEVTARAAISSSAGITRMRSMADVQEALVAEARKAAPAPANLKQPKVVGIDASGDDVVLLVESLEGFVRAQGGSDTSTSEVVSPAVSSSGTGGPIRIVMPKAGAAGFYRAVRSN